jgi:hypothetical protein
MRVLLVTFDCLPRRWLGCYGGHDLPTPGFDALASHGTTYDLAFASDVSRVYEQPQGFEADTGANLKIDGLAVPVTVRVLGTDQPRARRGAVKSNGSQLVKSLDEGVTFLEENSSRPVLAWLRHPGFRVQARPRMATGEVEAIAEQLVELDCSVGVFFERWRETAEDDWRLIVTGAEGLLQPQATEESADPQLCDDWVHVPLWGVAGAGELFGRRDSRLVTTDVIAPTLRHWFSAAEGEPDDRLGAGEPDADAVLIRGPGQRGLRTRNWFFRKSDKSDAAELFRKPEDLWDVCDVADRRPEVCEELAARLAAVD